MNPTGKRLMNLKSGDVDAPKWNDVQEYRFKMLLREWYLIDASGLICPKSKFHITEEAEVKQQLEVLKTCSN